MYNNKNSFQPSPTSRQTAMRHPVGRSCPASALAEAKDDLPIPMLDERMGNRGCDGNLRVPQSHPDSIGFGWGLTDHPLAMVYSPYQLFRDVYSPDNALARGTLFAELDLPFEGDKKRNGGLC